MYIKSITSGNPIPAVIIRTSAIRQFFGLAHTFVEYYGTNLSGPVTRNGWFHSNELHQ